MEKEFTFERQTKNTVRYAEVVEPDGKARIGTLYVQKWALMEEFGEYPERLIVTIEVAE